jgi:hypothetical protein
MRVALWLLVASVLLIGSTCAAPVADEVEQADAVVEESDWPKPDSPLLAEYEVGSRIDNNLPSNSTFNATKSPMFAMTCVQRKQEALRTLMNMRAAETLKKAAATFDVQDTKASWRVKQWHTRYIHAASNYAFFCEQSARENKLVSETIHVKEGLEAQKAALRGVQDATYKHKEALAKARKAAKEAATKKEAADHESKQKKLIQLMAEQARLERLRSYPQSSVNLMGFVADASTGKGMLGVNITSECPFDTYSGTTEFMEKGSEFSKYMIKNGVTGPEGYRCYLTYAQAGYVPLRFRILIQAEETQGIFRHAVLMPSLPTPPAYRIVLQYGNMPADIDAHLQVFADGQSTPVDVSGHRGEVANFEYTKKGSKDAQPFVTLDVNANQGYGPQTHSIHQPQVGSYGYYVKNYDHHFTNNEKFHESDARVFVYKGNELTHRFAIRNAQGAPAKFWHVFRMTCTQPDDSVECHVEGSGEFVKTMPTSPSGTHGNTL